MSFQPVNTKSLFAFVCQQMQNLSDDKITVADAKAQAGLVNSAVKVLNYEIERVKTQMSIREFNVKTGATLELRQIEPKGFDDTTHLKDNGTY